MCGICSSYIPLAIIDISPFDRWPLCCHRCFDIKHATTSTWVVNPRIDGVSLLYDVIFSPFGENGARWHLSNQETDQKVANDWTNFTAVGYPRGVISQNNLIEDVKKNCYEVLQSADLINCWIAGLLITEFVFDRQIEQLFWTNKEPLTLHGRYDITF